MLWIGNNIIPLGDPGKRNHLGAFLGAMGQAGQESPDVAPSEGDKLTGEHLGRRVAETVTGWKRGA